LRAQIDQAVADFPAVIDHLPARMTYLDREDRDADGTPREKVGRIILAGGELLVERATLADNFCSRWSGGLGFVAHRDGGSEVSIEPSGDVYPCCLQTRLPIGNLKQEPLLDILERQIQSPVYRAISRGQQEEMGMEHGWSVEQFHQKSRTVTPGGLPYQNLCIGCDRFHDEVLRPLLGRSAARKER
jgi:MoaA/NifB/PqqE/SkfB family radical SAM enzyme